MKRCEAFSRHLVSGVVGCRFSDYQLTSGREMSKAELESLEDIVVRHWSGFLELQRIARIVEAQRALQVPVHLPLPIPPPEVSVSAVAINDYLPRKISLRAILPQQNLWSLFWLIEVDACAGPCSHRCGRASQGARADHSAGGSGAAMAAHGQR